MNALEVIGQAFRAARAFNESVRSFVQAVDTRPTPNAVHWLERCHEVTLQRDQLRAEIREFEHALDSARRDAFSANVECDELRVQLGLAHEHRDNLKAEVHEHEDRWYKLSARVRDVMHANAVDHSKTNANDTGYSMLAMRKVLEWMGESSDKLWDEIGHGTGYMRLQADDGDCVPAVSTGPVLGVKLLRGRARMPEYAHDGDAGMDVFACLDVPFHVAPGETVKIPLGIALEIPDGYFVDLRSRSGHDSRGRMTVHLGTGDGQFRGEYHAIVYVKPYIDDCGRPMVEKDNYVVAIHHGDKIAQLVLHKRRALPIVKVDVLSETARGANGFGSSDRKEKA